MQTAESSNAAMIGRVSLPDPVPVYPDLDAPGTEQTGILANEQKKSSNKPEEQEKRHKGIERRYIRAKLTRDLWEEYQKPTITTSEKIKLGALLAKLTDKRKTAPKPIFG